MALRLSTVAERARLGQAIAAARQHGVDSSLVQKAEAALAQARAPPQVIARCALR